MAAWLVLILSFPVHPSSLRVKAWRRLRTIGAVPLKRSVYLLPITPENQEQFQWLTQEVQKDGGEATLLTVDQIQNVKPAEVVRLFQHARDQDYRTVAEGYRKLLRGLERTGKGRTAARRDEELARLSRELGRIREIDFFEAPGYQEAKRLQETIEMRRHPRAAKATPSQPNTSLESLRGRGWVTRPRPHVDRIGSAWLIKRFIDPEALFIFARPEEFPEDAVPFDALGAEFGHQGEDCTFETLLKRSGLRDRRLGQLAEIVHEVDLHDGKFPREEARGVDLAIRGLLGTFKDDQEVLTHGFVLFDGLYAALGDRKR